MGLSAGQLATAQFFVGKVHALSLAIRKCHGCSLKSLTKFSSCSRDLLYTCFFKRHNKLCIQLLPTFVKFVALAPRCLLLLDRRMWCL